MAGADRWSGGGGQPSSGDVPEGYQPSLGVTEGYTPDLGGFGAYVPAPESSRPGQGEPGRSAPEGYERPTTVAPGAQVTSPWGSAAAPTQPPVRGGRVGRMLVRLCLMLVVPVMIIGVATPLAERSLRSTIVPTAVLAQVGETSAVLVPYQRSGSGSVMTRLTGGMFQTRLAAVGLGSDELLWDVQLTDSHFGGVAVLAADAVHTYVATDDGLVVLSTDDGSVTARGTEIDGLGDDAVLDSGAYGYDPAANLVVTVNARGGLMEIPVGSTTATAASAATEARWSGALRPNDSAWMYVGEGFDETTQEWTGADGTSVALVEIDEAFGRSRLVVVGADGTAVEGPELIDASIVLAVTAQTDVPAPGGFVGDDPEVSVAGLSAGVVLVEHDESINSSTTVLSVVDATTGEVVGTLAGGRSVLGALDSADGVVLLLEPALSGRLGIVALVDATGVTVSRELGGTNLLGSPR